MKSLKAKSYNPETKTTSTEFHLKLDTSDPAFRLILKLAKFYQRWIDKEGSLPETIDRECIELMGMRFGEFLMHTFEIHRRGKLLKAGMIREIDQYIGKEFIDDEWIEISRDEHEEMIKHFALLEMNRNNMPAFISGLKRYKI